MSINDDFQSFKDNSELLKEVVEGDENTTAVTPGGRTLKSIAKAIADAVQAGLSGILVTPADAEMGVVARLTTSALGGLDLSGYSPGTIFQDRTINVSAEVVDASGANKLLYRSPRFTSGAALTAWRTALGSKLDLSTQVTLDAPTADWAGLDLADLPVLGGRDTTTNCPVSVVAVGEAKRLRYEGLSFGTVAECVTWANVVRAKSVVQKMVIERFETGVDRTTYPYRYDPSSSATVDGGLVHSAEVGRILFDGDTTRRLCTSLWGFFPSLTDSKPSRLKAAIKSYRKLTTAPGYYTCLAANTIFIYDKLDWSARGVTLAAASGAINQDIALGSGAFIIAAGHFGDPTNDDVSTWRTNPASASATEDAWAPRKVIQNQSAGLYYVTTATPSDAAAFAVGDCVRIRWGKDHNIPDVDTRAPGDRVNEVVGVNAETGQIRLKYTIEKAINDYGWAADGGTKFNALEPAVDLEVVAGQYAIDLNDTKKLWRAETSGTMTADTIAGDGGVTWSSLPITGTTVNRWTAGVGFPPSFDGTPTISKVSVPCRDITIDGLTVTSNGTTSGAPHAFFFSNVLRGSLLNCRVDGANMFRGGGLQFNFGSHHCLVENYHEDSVYGSNAANFFLDFASATVTVRNAHFSSRDQSGAIILAEVGTQLRLDNVTINRSEVADEHVRFLGGSEVWLTNSTLIGGGAPYARSGEALDDDGIPEVFTQGFLREYSGNVVHTNSRRGLCTRGMMGATVHQHIGNSYTFYDVPNLVFVPKRMARVRVPIVPQGRWNAAPFIRWLRRSTLDRLSPEIRSAYGIAWLVSASAHWSVNANAAGASVALQMRSVDISSGTSYASLFTLSLTDASNTLTVTDTAPDALLRAGSGGSVRLFNFPANANFFPGVQITPTGLTHFQLSGINTTTNVFAATAHPLAVGDLISIQTSGVYPAAGGVRLTENDLLYVHSLPDADKFAVCRYPGGPILGISDAGNAGWITKHPGMLYLDLEFLIS